MMTRHTARVGRTGLVIIGLILLLGAGAVLARGLNASTTVLGNPHAALLTQGQVQYPAKNSWVWPAVAAGSFVIAVLALWWMAAQARTRAVRRVPLEPDRLHGNYDAERRRGHQGDDRRTQEPPQHPGIRRPAARIRDDSRPPVGRHRGEPCRSSAARSTGTSRDNEFSVPVSRGRKATNGLVRRVLATQTGEHGVNMRTKRTQK
jgi:hypothetical protein